MKLVVFTAQVSPYHDARYTAATKHFDEVHVVSSVNAGDFPEFLAQSLGNYKLHQLYKGREAYKNATVSRELPNRVRDTLFRLQPDAIAAAGWTVPESLAALKYSRQNDIPTIVMSESQVDDAPRSIIRETIKRSIVSQFDAALVGGPSHADYVARLGIPRKKVHFGYNAVDNDYFEKNARFARDNAEVVRTKLSLPNRYILASARFIRKKNLSNLVIAYAKVRNRFHSLPDLVLLGDGPERAAVEACIRSYDVADFVHLPGFRGYEKLPATYALSEGFLHVSNTEQWGLVINEAMASGVPVIASEQCGAARTVIEDGVNALLTGTDVSDISNAIFRLFRMTAEQRSEMGRAGSVAIRDWGPERFGSGLAAAVQSASQSPRRGRIPVWNQFVFSQLQKRVVESVS